MSSKKFVTVNLADRHDGKPEINAQVCGVTADMKYQPKHYHQVNYHPLPMLHTKIN